MMKIIGRLIAAVVSLIFLFSCGSFNSDIDYKDEMRKFVIEISEFARTADSEFIVIPQNGIELITIDGEETAETDEAYMDAIDGNGQEDLFYGYNADDESTAASERSYLQAFLNKSKAGGNVILVTDYCSTTANVDDSYLLNKNAGYISFAAEHRELDNIPGYPNPLHSENAETITSLDEIENFLYLINPENYSTKATFISAVTSTNYDLIIMDLFFTDGSQFTSAETAQLRMKANGGKRLVICYMSIGEAEDYRYYWNADWNIIKPDWIEKENPYWAGNYKVRYWDEDWKDIIYGNENSYTNSILDAGFDGVYLDIIDAFEYFE